MNRLQGMVSKRIFRDRPYPTSSAEYVNIRRYAWIHRTVVQDILSLRSPCLGAIRVQRPAANSHAAVRGFYPASHRSCLSQVVMP